MTSITINDIIAAENSGLFDNCREHYKKKMIKCFIEQGNANALNALLLEPNISIIRRVDLDDSYLFSLMRNLVIYCSRPEKIFSIVNLIDCGFFEEKTDQSYRSIIGQLCKYANPNFIEEIQYAYLNGLFREIGSEQISEIVANFFVMQTQAIPGQLRTLTDAINSGLIGSEVTPRNRGLLITKAVTFSRQDIDNIFYFSQNNFTDVKERTKVVFAFFWGDTKQMLSSIEKDKPLNLVEVLTSQKLMGETKMKEH